MPERIQRSRARGWMMPDDALYVGRPTRWGNPHVVVNDKGAFTVDGQALPTRHTAHAYATALYEIDLIMGDLTVSIDEVVKWLGDADLACWCPPNLPCHADVLLAYANPGSDT